MELEDVPFKFIREITNDFSKKREAGEGAFAVVYKGVTKDGADVAVKKPKPCLANLDHKQFKNEFYNLRKLNHQNIVRILGYCYETEKKHFIMPDGSKELIDEINTALCFEYLHNGSLDKHIPDEFSGLDWHTRYKLIKGICEGLKYIHTELEQPMYHLDLKPQNILLDRDMVPKIADFGLSRIFGKEPRRITKNPYGTCAYQPPEYIDKGEISGKFDIFSLGVIMIKIVSGHKGYPRCLDMSSDKFIDQVRRNWREMLRASGINDSSLEAYCRQVETCSQIALNCVEEDSQKRPNIVEITKKLNETEADIVKLSPKGCCKTISGMMMHNNKIEIRKESKDLTGQQQNIKLMSDPICSELEFVDDRETSSDVVEELIVGRTEEQEKIVTDLHKGMSKNIIILPIYGIGGIGKTTFARLIYNDPKFKCYSHVWVYVSNRFDLKKIHDSIISQLPREEMINSCLRDLVSGKKIMIVLDDLWEDNQFQLQELMDMIYHDHSNIICLVTTRSEHIAKRISINLQPYKILPLTNDMCWDIIKKRSGFESRDDKEQLAGIGLEIAQKCGGLALAAQSLGFTLQFMNFYEWVKVKDSDMWNALDWKDNHVHASLKLSYSYMSACLKSCFTYCAIFPKGHKIAKKDLIYQWISLDLIKPTNLLSNIELCEKYITQLLGLSFLQRSVVPMKYKVHHEDKVFTMHDLVHDLAEQLMVDAIRDSGRQDDTGGSIIQFELLNDSCESMLAFTKYNIKIRGMRFVDSDRTVLQGGQSSSESMFLSFRVRGSMSPRDSHFWVISRHLRILDLSECYVQKLPDSIGNLRQLRYLDAPRIQHTEIPNCITKFKLIHLSLRESSNILVLPKSIEKLEGLMYLDLSRCSRMKNLPVSFGKLKKLVHLDLSYCSHVRGVTGPLRKLTNLEYLNLCGAGYSDIKMIQNAKFMFSLTKLRYLNLSSKSSVIQNLSKALSRLTNLEYLNLSGVHRDSLKSEGPIVTFQNLKNLVYLDLQNSTGFHGLQEAFGSLTKLQYLNLIGCECVLIDTELHPEQMSEAMGHLTQLRSLSFSRQSIFRSGYKAFDIFYKISDKLPNLEYQDLCEDRGCSIVPDPFVDHSYLDLPDCCVLAGDFASKSPSWLL